MRDVFYSGVGVAVDAGLRAVRVGAGAETFAVGNQQMPAVGRNAHRSGIPSDRNKAERTAFAGPAQIEYGNKVVIRVRDKERLFIRRKCQAVRRRTAGSIWKKRRPDGLQRFAG